MIFVDDVDRCMPRKVAEVVEAINLSLCGDYPDCIFVLGMEPAMVAAALEVANKEVIEKVSQLSLENSPVPLGWRFMEKIVQLPIIVPPPTDLAVDQYLRSLTGVDAATTEHKSRLQEEKVNRYKEQFAQSQTVADVVTRTERLIAQAPEEERSAIAEASNQKYAEKFSERDPAVKEFVESAAVLIGKNPRQIKRYINVFRFYSTLRHNLWSHSLASSQEMEFPDDKQLAKFIALMIQWPHAADCIRIMLDPLSTKSKHTPPGSLLALLEKKSRSIKGDQSKADVQWSEFLKSHRLSTDGWLASREFRQFLSKNPRICQLERCGLW